MSTRATRSILFLLAASGLAGMPPTASAFVNDGKVTNGAECQPYSTTTLPSELSFRANGLKNISANAEYVVCNIIVDTDTPVHWTDSSPGAVIVNFHSVAAGTLRCELYVGSNLLGSPVAYIEQREMTANDVESVLFNEASASGVIAPFGSMPVSLYCRIPSGASLVNIHVTESVDTTD